MALQELALTEVKKVSGGSWDGVDWASFLGTGAIAVLDGFEWPAFLTGAAVEAWGWASSSPWDLGWGMPD